MKTVDVHTHLLSPQVQFDRLYDKIAVQFFAKALGVHPRELQADPFGAYVKAAARTVSQSRYVDAVCLFGVDSRLDEKGRETDRDKTVCAMTEDVLAVAGEYPRQFIPFLSVNPHRHGALDLIDEYVGRGCRGAKFLQNYWGLDLNNESFIPYYEKLKAHNIPLIIHIGSEYSVDTDTRFEHVDMLDLPLACGVTVIAAHMGLGRVLHKLKFWRNLSRNPGYFDPDYFSLLEKLRTHENLYADLAAILAPLRARALRHLAEQTDVHQRILFGTDYPVPFAIRWNTYDLPHVVRGRINGIENPFDRYIAVLLEYFSTDSAIFQNYKRVLGE